MEEDGDRRAAEEWRRMEIEGRDGGIEDGEGRDGMGDGGAGRR